MVAVKLHSLDGTTYREASRAYCTRICCAKRALKLQLAESIWPQSHIYLLSGTVRNQTHVEVYGQVYSKLNMA